MATATKPANPALRSWLRRNLTFILALPFVVVLVVKGFGATGLNLSESFSTILTQLSLSEEWTTGSISLLGQSVPVGAGIVTGAIVVVVGFILFIRSRKKAGKRDHGDHFFGFLVGIGLLAGLGLVIGGVIWFGSSVNNYVHGPTRNIIDHSGQGSATAPFDVLGQGTVNVPAKREQDWYKQALILNEAEFCPVKDKLGQSPNGNGHLQLQLINGVTRYQVVYSYDLQRILGELNIRQVEITVHVWKDNTGGRNVRVPIPDPQCP